PSRSRSEEPDMLLLILLGIAAAIALITYTVLSQVEERAVVRSSLRQLDGYEVENVRDQELLRPFAERALMPFVGGLTGIGRRFTPVGYVEKTRQKFVWSGQGTAESVDRFLAIRVVTVALVPVWFLFVFVGGVGSGMLQLMLFGLGALVLVLGPDAMLNRRVEERQSDIQRGLPDILDLLTISVEAGL
ncbi:hypothetical protein B7486_75505, partial [cyanobacterium TDX16]